MNFNTLLENTYSQFSSTLHFVLAIILMYIIVYSLVSWIAYSNKQNFKQIILVFVVLIRMIPSYNMMSTTKNRLYNVLAVNYKEQVESYYFSRFINMILALSILLISSLVKHSTNI